MAEYDDLAAQLAEEKKQANEPGTIAQPSPATTPDEGNAWQSLADDMAEEQNAAIKHNISQAITTPADQAVKAQKIATATSMPVDTVKANLHTLEQQQESARIADMVKANPALASFYGVKENADVAHDDAGVLSQIGDKLNNLGRSAAIGIGPSFADSFYGVGQGVASLGDQLIGQPFQSVTGLQLPFGPVAEGLKNIRHNHIKPLQTQLEAGQTEMGFVEQGINSGIQSFAQTLPATVMSVLTANPAPLLATGAISSGGQATGKALDAGKSPVQALSYGAQDAVAEVVTERIPVARLIGDLKAGTPFLKTLVHQYALEVPTEIGATLWQNFNEWANMNPEKTVNEFVREQPAAVGQTILATLTATTLTTSGGGAVNALAKRMDERDKARLNATNLDSLNGMATSSALLNRDPSRFHQVVNQMVQQSGGPQSVFIPAGDMASYFQSQGVDPYSIAEEMPGVGRDEFQRALSSGGDVQVPMADYMTYLAKQHGEALKPSIRFGDPAAMTLNQADEFSAEAEQLVQQEFEAAQARSEQEGALDQTENQVYRNVLSQLEGSGQSNIVAAPQAILHSRFARTMAASEGEAGAALLNERYGNLSIQGTMPSRQVADRQADTGLILSPEARAALEGELQMEERQFINDAINVKRSFNAYTDSQPTTPEQVQKALGMETRPVSLLQAVEKWGGIASGLSPEELKNLQEAKKKGTLKGKNISSYYPGELRDIFDGLPERTISRYVKTNGRSMEDDLPLSAAEAGYLGEDMQRSPGDDAASRADFTAEAQRRFAEVMKRALRGEAVYSADIQNRLAEIGTQQNLALEGRDANLQMLQPYGITPESSVADIARALTRQFLDTEGGTVPNPNVMFQPAPPENTSAFQTWFAGSQMVDSNGVPQVLYHGTQDDVDYFDLAHTNRKDTGWAGEGVYLTNQSIVANAYAQMKRGGGVGANVMPVYASIRNPYIVSDPFEVKAQLRAGGKPAAIEFTENLQANGYDGVILQYPGGVQEIVAFEPAQVKSVFNRGTWNAADPMVLNQDATREQNLAKFMEGSKVQDVVYHGTTGDFDTFDRSRANPGGDLGAGFYFTNNQDDVGVNYAGEGPDLTVKIDVQAERLINERDLEWNDENMEAARAEVRAQLSANGGTTMPVYLSIKNPVILGGSQETMFELNTQFDEEGDVIDESGPYLDLMNAIDEVAPNFQDVDAEQLKGDLANAFDGEGISAGDVFRAFKESEGAMYATDADGNGDLSNGEFMRAVFEEMGYDGIIDHTVNQKFGNQRKNGRAMEGVDEGTTHYVAFRPEQIKSALGNRGTFDANDPIILNQNQDAPQKGKKTVAPRGQIRFSVDNQGQRQTLISLFKSADNSTFLHESGHFFLENMLDLAELPTASEKLKADTAAILDWFGVENRSQITTEHHEMWARGFEQFLMKGKAPSSALRDAFNRFRSWLIGIYRTAKALNVTVSPEVDAVMQRMLATEEEIAQAEMEAGDLAMFADFTTLQESGLTGAEWESYQALAMQAHDQASGELMGKLVAEQRRTTRKWWKEERERVRKETQEVVETNPTYQAAHWLAKGKLPDGETPAAPHAKLSYAAVADLLGDEKLAQQLPRYYGLMVVKHGGVHPDVVADLFGFGSGEEMVRKLMTTPNPRDVIEARTDATMVERHGDMMRDGTIEQAAQEALENDARGDLMARELQLLERMANSTTPTVTQVLKNAANRTMSERTVAQALTFDTYLAAERRAGNAAQRAFAKGDFALALTEKRKQLMNHYMAQFAKNAKADTDAFLRFIQKFDRKTTRKKLERDYLDQVDALLDRFVFTGSVSAAQDARAVSFAEFAKKQEANKQEIVYDDKLLNEAYRRHYREMPWDEFSGLMDTVRNLEHLARLTQRAIVEVEQEMFEDQVAAVADTIKLNKKERKQSANMERTATEKFVHGLEMIDAEHTKMEFLFEDADGYEALGTVWQNFYQPLQEASNQELIMLKDVAKGWKDAFADYDSKERQAMFGKRMWVPEFNKNVTKSWIMSLALNYGNEGNRKAILDANWGTSERPVQVDEAAVRRVLDKHMTKKDWDTVQKVWDLIDAQWPAIAKLERELSGVVPQKVEATPVETPHGTYRGGYYPLKYDGEHSWIAFKRAEKDAVEGTYGGNYLRAATRHGHTKERVGSAGQRPMMTLNVAVDHLYNAVHDVTHRKAILNAVRLIENERVRAAFAEHYGSHYPKMILKWLNGIASDTNSPANTAEKLLSAVRSNTTVVYMGWKMTTVFSQLAGFTNSAHFVGYGNMAKNMAKFYKKGPWSIDETLEFAFGKSVELRNRRENFDREIRNEVMKLEKGDKQYAIKQSFFSMIGWMDMMVAVPTWTAAYEKGLTDFKGDEGKAIQYADQAVRMAQSSGLPKDLANIQSSGGQLFKLFTMFYSFFSVTYNQFKRETKRTNFSRLEDYPRFMKAMFSIWLAPAMLGALFAGQGPDDDESWFAWAAENVALFPFASVILVRDVANYVARPYFGAQMTPVEGALRALGDTLGALNDGEISRQEARAAFDLLGYAKGLPTRQMWATGEFMTDWMNGNVEPDNPAEAVKGLLFGKHAIE